MLLQHLEYSKRNIYNGVFPQHYVQETGQSEAPSVAIHYIGNASARVKDYLKALQIADLDHFVTFRK